MNEERSSGLRARAREVLEHNAAAGVPAPDFGADKTWFNVSRPLSLRGDLAGKLVLLHFWSSSCIHCTHVLNDLAWLEEKYHGEPFVVVGCHSDKSTNEADVARVREAVLRLEIAHPVFVDRNFDVWKRFGVRARPTLMLLAPDGRILGTVSGEGQRAVLDVLIEQTLEMFHERQDAFEHSKLPLRLERAREFPRELHFPSKVLVDASSRRLYVADTGHHRVLELDLDGRFLRAFGSGTPGMVDGAAPTARLRGPQGLALFRGVLIVADTLNHALRSIDLDSGIVRTLAGTGRQELQRANSSAGLATGLNSPRDVLAHNGRLLIAMAGHHQVWEYDFESSSVQPLAGNGNAGLRDGSFDEASFAQPSALAAHGRRVYVVDAETNAVRELDLESRRVSTAVGGSHDPRRPAPIGDADDREGRLQHPLGISIDSADLSDVPFAFVADTFHHKIKLFDLTTREISDYAGDGEAGFVDGDNDAARFREPNGVAAFEGSLFVADTNNHALRRIDLEQHVVATLETSSVPVPMHRLTEARDTQPRFEEWPEQPGRIRPPALKRRLASGDGELVIELTLAEGAKLVPHAPSQVRVTREGGLVAAKQVLGRIEQLATSIPLGVEGPGLLRVQALYYVCDAEGVCTMHTEEWRLEIDVHERASRRVHLALTPRADRHA